jgi:ABC-type nitrate/sulfonate/bicarbonate transport system substrate-binding protein
VKDNPEATRRFMKSLVEAIALMKQNKAVAFRSMAKWFNITDPEQQKLLYDGNREMPSKPYPFVEGIKRAMELYDGNEMRKYKAEDFYDITFVKELDENGFIDGLYKK